MDKHQERTKGEAACWARAASQEREAEKSNII